MVIKVLKELRLPWIHNDGDNDKDGNNHHDNCDKNLSCARVGNKDDDNNNQNDDDDDQRPELCHEAWVRLDRWTSRSNHGKRRFHWYSVLQMISMITSCQEKAEFQINFDCRKPLPWEKRWRQSLSASDHSNSGLVLRPGSGPGDHDHDDHDDDDVHSDEDVYIDDWQTDDEIEEEHYVKEEDIQPTSEKMARTVGRLLH